LFQTLRRQDTHRLDGLPRRLCLDSERRSEKQQGYDGGEFDDYRTHGHCLRGLIIRRTRRLPNTPVQPPQRAKRAAAG